MKSKTRGAHKRRTTRGWYKPAGERVNRILDDFELNIARIHESFLRQIGPVLKEAGEVISCKPGCNHCCKCAFVCTFLEGLCIARYLLAYQRPDWQGMWPKLREHELRQQELGAPGWFQLRIDCLFLKDGMCDVYPVRPLNCRTHYAVSDPEFCTSEKGVARILATEAMMDLRTAVAKGATQRLLGRDDFLVAVLPGAVNLGIHALTTGDYEMRGQVLEGEALDAFKKDWQDTSADAVKQAEVEAAEEKKDDGP